MNAFRIASIVMVLLGMGSLLLMRPAGTSLFKEPGVWVTAGVLALAMPPLVFPSDSLLVYAGIAASFLCSARVLWLLFRPRKDLTSTAS